MGMSVIYCVLVSLAHNHPSHNPEASEDDIKLKKRLTEVCEIVGIAVLDHVTLGDSR